MFSYDVCECGAPLQRIERETPKPTGAEVVLRVIAAGVCHSDLHIWDGYYDIGGGQKLRLQDRGVNVETLQQSSGVSFFGFFDPDGNRLEVRQV